MPKGRLEYLRRLFPFLQNQSEGNEVKKQIVSYFRIIYLYVFVEKN